MSDISVKEAPGAALRRGRGDEPMADSARRDISPTTEAKLRWDDQKMATTFANVVNIQSTREQVDLFFGTNQTWNAANEKTLTIELSNRIILSPFAAKRLALALDGVLREYESRYGKLNVEG
jgi:hypothetical protein